MAKLIYISREELEKGRREMEKLLAEDELWQEQLKRFRQYEQEEKARRDAEYAARKASSAEQEEA